MSTSRFFAPLAVAAIFLAAPTTTHGQSGNPSVDLVVVNVCVYHESFSNGLTTLVATYNPVTRDTVHNGEKFGTGRFHPRWYAPAQPWFASNEVMNYGAGEYTKYGLPRELSTNDLKRAGRMGGIFAFVAKSDTSALPEVLYLPARPGRVCVFQPYQLQKPDDFYRSASYDVEERRFADALKILQRPSLRRHGPARVLLGQMHAQGLGVPVDSVAAVRLFEEGIQLGDPEGLVALGLIARANNRSEEAVRFFRAAHDQGSGWGSLHMADFHARLGRHNDRLEAFRYLYIAKSRATYDGSMLNAAETAIVRLWESLVPALHEPVAPRAADEERAREGDRVAAYLLGRRYELGLYGEKNLQRALEYYDASARMGFQPALDALRRLAGSGVRR